MIGRCLILGAVVLACFIGTRHHVDFNVVKVDILLVLITSCLRTHSVVVVAYEHDRSEKVVHCHFAICFSRLY